MFDSHYYILKGKYPQKIATIEKWAEWMNNGNRIVKQDSLFNDMGEVFVSTAFLGVDHNYNPKLKFPILFETMIFGGKHDQYQARYISWDESLMGHKKALRLAKMSIIWENHRLIKGVTK